MLKCIEKDFLRSGFVLETKQILETCKKTIQVLNVIFDTSSGFCIVQNHVLLKLLILSMNY